jgi:hypothetical protein
VEGLPIVEDLVSHGSGWMMTKSRTAAAATTAAMPELPQATDADSWRLARREGGRQPMVDSMVSVMEAQRWWAGMAAVVDREGCREGVSEEIGWARPWGGGVSKIGAGKGAGCEIWCGNVLQICWYQI